jgi:farnesyl-diphosphate farnesyltransferase
MPISQLASDSAAATFGPAMPGSPDDEFQARMLAGVSRTFALTIPVLPLPLARVVSNAYLLCRVVDTIEDEPSLDAATKRELAATFVASVEGTAPPAAFAHALAPRLSAATLPAERELVADSAQLLAITHRFSAAEQAALAACVRVMADGMIRFQEANDGRGLADVATLDRYCYHVAGVVGEMLTRLFAVHSPAIAARAERMMPLAVSFGEGLQMTNILKDVWNDLERGACWLPRDVFAREGFDLDRIAEGPGDAQVRMIPPGRQAAPIKSLDTHGGRDGDFDRHVRPGHAPDTRVSQALQHGARVRLAGIDDAKAW